MASSKAKTKQRPPQHQDVQPGKEASMHPKPEYENTSYIGSGKLKAKTAIITGGDSGIGRAVALCFAKEGANIAIAYLNEKRDAAKTKSLIEAEGKECMLFQGDITDSKFCNKIARQTVKEFGTLNILVNNAAMQFPQKRLEDITNRQLEKTFATNVFSYFYMTRAALEFLTEGDVIINTASITAYRGSPELLDYSAAKGAIVSFTRSLSIALAKRKIRVNAVAPGPVWTPLIPASFNAKHVETFGSENPMGRAGEPYEIAPSYVFLASEDSSFFSGQVLHPNGGEIVNA